MRRWVVVATAAVAFLSACGEPAPITPGAPDDPVISSAEPTPGDRTGGGAQRVVPRDGLVDVRPIPFKRAKPAADGMSIDVFWYSGIEDCYGLDRIEVKESEEEVEITLFEGREPEAEVCIEIAVRKVTRVTLDEPLGDRTVTDGAEAH